MTSPQRPTRPVDAVALGRTRRRLEQAARQTGAPPWLHAEVARRMAERLVLLRQPPAVVLDWWPGAGGSWAALRAALPQARLQAPEQGLEAQRAPGPWWKRWRREASPEAWIATPVQPGQASMVWANMLLHHEPDPPTLLRQWHEAMCVDGVLMFSTLGPGTLMSLPRLYAASGWGVPSADLVDMHDIGDMLVEAGFADPVMDQEVIRLTWDKPEKALLELRSLGSNVSPARMAGLRTPRWRQRLCNELQRTATALGSSRVVLEFEIVYGHAFKPEPRHRLAAETHIGVDELRRSLRRDRGMG